MFKFAVVILAVIACAAAKPGLIGAHLAHTVPAALVAAPAPVVTAVSSQVIARNHNGIVTTPVVAPPVADIPVAAPIAAPITAYRTPIISRVLASAPWTHSHPLAYAAAPVLW